MRNKIEYTTLELFNMLSEAKMLELDQSIINQIIFEIVCRLYIPFGNKSFDEMLLEYGYVDIRIERKKK